MLRLLLCSILCVTYVISFDVLQPFGNEYERISAHLESEVATDDVEPNMEALRGYLSTRLGKKWIMGQPMIRAIKLLLNLSLTDASENCSRLAYLALAQNLQATGGKILKTGDLKRRVDRILYRYSVQHAIRCQSTYQSAYEELHQRLNALQVKYVETFTDAIMSRALEKGLDFYTDDKERIHDNFVADIYQLNRNEHASIAIDTISSLSQGEFDRVSAEPSANKRDQRKEQRRANLKALFYRYILEPCEYYVKSLGQPVFSPATYDSSFHYDPNVGDMDYHRAWARFRICQSLVKDKKKMLWNNVANQVL